MIEPEPHEETWLFAGSRYGRRGTRVHAWLPQPDDDFHNELWFRPRGQPALGSEYAVRVTRKPDGEVTMHGQPNYRGRHENDELRARAEARHRAAETTLRRVQLQRADKRASALDAALEPLVTISGELRAPDRDAFLAYIIRKITRPW